MPEMTMPQGFILLHVHYIPCTKGLASNMVLSMWLNMVTSKTKLPHHTDENLTFMALSIKNLFSQKQFNRVKQTITYKSDEIH